MSVISITITESEDQIVAGIPLELTITTNISSTIFYTLDGTDPTVNSLVVAGPVAMPTDKPKAIFKVFATDGYNTSSIITREYGPDIASNRNTHDMVTGIDFIGSSKFIFGTTSPSDLGIYTEISSLNTIDSPEIVGTSTGYDGTATGTSAAETDVPLTELDVIYSETDRIGNVGEGIGTVPAHVTVRQAAPTYPSSSSDANSMLFNPRAQVIFQDGREDAYDKTVPKINRPFFSLEPTGARDGALLLNRAWDGGAPSGSFLRGHYNPRENTYSMYYFDSKTNRWIISKESVSMPSNIVRFDSIIFPSSTKGSTKVFKWNLFRYTKLI